MKRLALLGSIVLVTTLVGCAAPGYDSYLETQEKISENNKSAANVQAIAMQSIANSSDDPTVKAVAAMMLGFTSSRNNQQMVAAPQNQALEWFKAATPLLGTWINGRYTLEAQKVSSEAQVEMYTTQMQTFGSVANTAITSVENVGISGMDYASKPPLVVHGTAPTVTTETTTATEAPTE